MKQISREYIKRLGGKGSSVSSSIVGGGTVSWSDVTGKPNTLEGYGITDGVSTATTWWGQSVNNGAVTGDMTSVGAITMSGHINMNNNKGIYIRSIAGTKHGISVAADNQLVLSLNSSNDIVFGWGARSFSDTYITGYSVHLCAGGSGTGLYVNAANNVGVGTSSPGYKLHVNGYTYTTRIYLASGVYLEYDSSNSGVHIVGAGVYSDSYVTALGVNSGGGGGGSSFDESAMWTALGTSIASKTIASVYLSNVTKTLTIQRNGVAIGTYDGTEPKTINITVSDGTTGDYLPLSGGTMSNTNLVRNMNADLLDGYDSTAFIRPIGAGDHNFDMADSTATGGVYQVHAGDATRQPSWPFNYGLVANFVSTNGHLQFASADGKNDIRVRSYWWTGNPNFGSYPEWRTLLHSGNSYVDNYGQGYINGVNITQINNAAVATAATKLQVARTLWGQSFDGTANVSGSMTSVGSISMSGNISGTGYIALNYNGSGQMQSYIGWHYTGTSTQSSRIIETSYGLLNINGALRVSNSNYVEVPSGYTLRIGSAVLQWDSTYNMLRLDGSIYATGGVAALGVPGNIDIGVSNNLLPSTNGTLTLGNISYRWRAIYFGYSGRNSHIIQNSSALDISSNNIFISGDTEFENNVYIEENLGVCGTNTNYTLYVSGNGYLTGNISAATVTNRSDMRMKDVLENIDLDTELIARAPTFRYTWRDSQIDTRLHVGTSAQYWQSVLSETVVADHEGMLGIDSATTALVSVISLARRVMSHEERIKALEEENEQLRNEIALLTH